VLRRQGLQQTVKPLVVITPKSLLRLPDAASPVDQFTNGGFLPVIGDNSIEATKVGRVLLCSGKVIYDLLAARQRPEGSNTAILRLEQFYPFPKNLLIKELSRFPNANDIRWVQEEPQNMGGWSFIESRLLRMLGGARTLRYVGRPASASPATGSHTIHQMEQQRLVQNAFGSA
jgi:2-oxoglutarate dehydrogenase complex dehydrogenase (E1) component-like enzyme